MENAPLFLLKLDGPSHVLLIAELTMLRNQFLLAAGKQPVVTIDPLTADSYTRAM